MENKINEDISYVGQFLYESSLVGLDTLIYRAARKVFNTLKKYGARINTDIKSGTNGQLIVDKVPDLVGRDNIDVVKSIAKAIEEEIELFNNWASWSVKFEKFDKDNLLFRVEETPKYSSF